MALREFSDSQGTRWIAWDIPPRQIFRPMRSGTDRRATAPVLTAPVERRSGSERRRNVFLPGLAYGWLCFESAREKRRVMPPPPGWQHLSDAQLETLCHAAAARQNARPARAA